jgi:uncharacterized protein YlzI (FlbEa/FlbD family)
MVLESPDEIIERVVRYRQSIFSPILAPGSDTHGRRER